MLRPIVKSGDEAVIITIAGKLSGTSQSAIIAAEETGNGVWVVDSGNVTIGQGIIATISTDKYGNEILGHSGIFYTRSFD